MLDNRPHFKKLIRFSEQVGLSGQVAWTRTSQLFPNNSLFLERIPVPEQVPYFRINGMYSRTSTRCFRTSLLSSNKSTCSRRRLIKTRYHVRPHAPPPHFVPADPESRSCSISRETIPFPSGRARTRKEVSAMERANNFIFSLLQTECLACRGGEVGGGRGGVNR